MNSTTIDRPLSDAAQLLLRRADELQQRKTMSSDDIVSELPQATSEVATLNVFKRGDLLPAALNVVLRGQCLRS